MKALKIIGISIASFTAFIIALSVVIAIVGAAAGVDIEEQPATAAATKPAKAAKAQATKANPAKADKEAAPVEPVEPVEPEPTSAQQNAIGSAEQYLDFGGFSRDGLIKQLKFEDYSQADATFAVDHVNADWNAEAVESAEAYLDMSSFSQQGLLDQLAFEGYTPEQAQHAVGQVY